MWQRLFEQYGNDQFTIVGLALDAEGIPPAQKYYNKYDVTFPALVDPDYATQFGAVPKTFFVDEHGVVKNLNDWEKQLKKAGSVPPVTDFHRKQWSVSASRLNADTLAQLAEDNSKRPKDLLIATQLGSRYLSLGLPDKAVTILKRAIETYEPKAVARRGGTESRLLGQAYFQLMRCYERDRSLQVQHATTSYNLNPSIGFAKQIARIIDPAKFDATEDGYLDNRFREATYQRLKRERVEWLMAD